MTRHYVMSRVELYKKVDSTWTDTAIVMDQITGLKVKTGVGAIKDTFEFTANHANDRLTRQFFSGNAVTTAFTLNYGPPTEFLGTDSFQVYVSDVLQTYGTNYLVSGTTLTFQAGSIPGIGVDNIEIRFEVISADDKCKIYIWKDLEWGSMTQDDKDNAFQMEGIIVEPRLRSTDAGRVLGVKGNGIIEVIFNALAFVKPKGQKKWYEIIQDMLAQINQNLPVGRKVYGGGSIRTESNAAALEWAELGNPTTKHDSSAFPDKQYYSSYKRAIEVLEEVTQDKYTEDADYYYYVAWDRTLNNNEGAYGLFIRYKNPSVSAGFEITQGTDNLQDVDMRRATEDVVNAVIYNCGFDPLERGMEYLNYDFTSQSSYGVRWKYVTTTSDLGQTVINQEFEANPDDWEQTDIYTRVENFPKDTAYPYTVRTFEDRDDDGEILTGTPIVVANDNQWADAVRIECRWQGNSRTDRIIRLYSNPRYKADLVFDATNDYVLGSAYNIIVPSFSLHTNHPIRIVDIQKTIWDTELSLEEDETVAGLG